MNASLTPVNGRAQPPTLNLTCEEQPYWDGLNKREIWVQRGRVSGIYLHPPVDGPPPWCPEDEILEWVSLGSDVTATIYSFTVVHRAFSSTFSSGAPYIVALADLDTAPGARIAANVIGVEPDEVQIGMRVKACWEDAGDGITLLQWAPINRAIHVENEPPPAIDEGDVATSAEPSTKDSKEHDRAEKRTKQLGPTRGSEDRFV